VVERGTERDVNRAHQRMLIAFAALAFERFLPCERRLAREERSDVRGKRQAFEEWKRIYESESHLYSRRVAVVRARRSKSTARAKPNANVRASTHRAACAICRFGRWAPRRAEWR
jgi:hypothetical protein